MSYTGARVISDEFPEGTGDVWLDNIDCTGTEKRFVECSFDTVGSSSCSHFEDASVRCQIIYRQFLLLEYSKFISVSKSLQITITQCSDKLHC